MKKRFTKGITRMIACVLSLIMIAGVCATPVHAAKKKDNSRAKYAMVFDSNYYASTYPDVVAAYGTNYNTLLTHYINNGMKEGRNASATFNAIAYRELNADIAATYGDNWAAIHEHYAVYGKNENRAALYSGNANNQAVKQNSNNKSNNASTGTVLGTYTTYYDATIARATNVVTAASRINGVVVGKGQSFSYSATILHRTTANGYVSAPIIVGKRHAMGIGGGVCQVSSTLYAAMLTAGLPATERYPHSLAVDYIPVGWDATIAGNAKDLKFVNTFNYPIIINASADNGTLTVTISRY